MLNAKEFPNFLTRSEVSDILTLLKNNNLWTGSGHSFWDGRVLNVQEIAIRDMGLAKKIYAIKNRILETVKKAYDLDQEIYPDILQLIRWHPGMEQPPHSDNMENTVHAPVHQHREFGVVIYLNDDYDGGRTFYPQHNFEIIPEPGKMAVHPASTDHMHGVTKIQGNTRYTMTTFLTFDKTRNIREVI